MTPILLDVIKETHIVDWNLVICYVLRIKSRMDINNKTIWQQAAGDQDRNYANICLKWDVILNGPGYAGKLPESQGLLRKDGWTSKKVTDLLRFSEKISDGDIVVLRMGTKEVLGVGIVVGKYEWLDEFSDIDGWDLQHVRRVKWVWTSLKAPKEFPVYTLKQGDTTQVLDSTVVKDWLKTLNILEENFTRELIPLPLENKEKINFEKISEYLFDQGVSSNSIHTLMDEIDELIRIAKWYKKHNDPSEFETVAYLVVPLLRALGWTPQKMAIEWNKVDVALFSQLPRKDENLKIVVEAKKKGNSCLSAKSQAQSYSEGKHNCNRLIVTDGLRYGIYLKNGDKFKLYAYLNLTALKNDYPIYECQGVKEALRSMTPEWSPNET